MINENTKERIHSVREKHITRIKEQRQEKEVCSAYMRKGALSPQSDSSDKSHCQVYICELHQTQRNEKSTLLKSENSLLSVKRIVLFALGDYTNECKQLMQKCFNT